MNRNQMTHNYQRDGLLRLPQFFSPKEVHNLREAIREYTEDTLQRLPRQGYVMASDGKTIRNLWHMEKYDEFFKYFALQDKLLDLIGPLLGGEPRLISVEAFNKPAKVTCETPYHQDNAYLGINPPDALLVWIAIDPALVSNGATYYLTGSHKNGALPHVESAPDGLCLALVDPPDPPSINELCMTLESGAVAIHHWLSVHRSQSNYSQQSRLSLIIVYRGAHTRIDPLVKRSYEALD